MDTYDTKTRLQFSHLGCESLAALMSPGRAKRVNITMYIRNFTYTCTHRGSAPPQKKKQKNHTHTTTTTTQQQQKQTNKQQATNKKYAHAHTTKTHA
jgi:hypothetical protein